LTAKEPIHPLFDLSGKVALVTGGSRGLGYQMVKAFAEAGADVVITSRKLDACEKVAREVERLGRRALAHSCHIAKWQEIDALVEAAYAHFGRIDILVNNAGMSPLAPSSTETSEELFDKSSPSTSKGRFGSVRLSASACSKATVARSSTSVAVAPFDRSLASVPTRAPRRHSTR
jgi:NAD(P)-dependent dehydrogenase (short-subunit alcohol dehydrogenase family)